MKHLACIIAITLCCHAGVAQHVTSLPEIIRLAQTESPQYRVQKTQREFSYYAYLTYKSSLKPQVSFNGNIPAYNKMFVPVTQPDGKIIYQPVQQNNSYLGFSLSQELPFSGGSVSLNTNLNRFDDLQGKTHQYNGTPFYIQLNQPVFGFNSLKWAKKIEPLRLEESKRNFALSMENIAIQMSSLYFNILDAQENMRISEINVANTTENYNIEKKRVSLGTTTEDKLLQLELLLLTCQQNLKRARYDYQVALLSLRAQLGSKDSAAITLEQPGEIPVFGMNLDTALVYARRNRPEFIAFERKRLEAARDLANTKAARQQVNISATFGVNRAAQDLNLIYTSPKEQQSFSIGFNIPIIDWGRRSTAYATAKAAQQLTEYNNEIDELNYTQEITTLVDNIPLLRDNIDLARHADSVAQRRYALSDNLYKTGKLSVSDLNIAQTEKDYARQGLLSALRAFWFGYYQLRRTTLYDFEHNQSIYP